MVIAVSTGHWVDEERYLAAEWFPGVERARAAKSAGKPLFASAPSFFVGMTTASATDVHQLLETLGGRIVASPEQATICLGHPTQRTRRHLFLPGATTIEVPEQWLYGAWPHTVRRRSMVRRTHAGSWSTSGGLVQQIVLSNSRTCPWRLTSSSGRAALSPRPPARSIS